MAEKLRESIRELVHVDYSRMSAAELDALVAGEETDDKFGGAQALAPSGFTYQWCRVEVYGKPDPGNIAMLEQRGWRAVPNSRHIGRWMPSDATGPIVVDGNMLMELPTPLYDAKRRFQERQAKGAVHDLQAQMIYAPPGTAPRDAHPRTKPLVRHTYERPMEIE